MGFRKLFHHILGICLIIDILKVRRGKFKRSGRFKLADISDQDAQKWFRFDKSDIGRIRLALRIPKIVTTKTRDRATGDEALCILLRRFAYPNRLFESSKLMKRSSSSFSHIYNHVLNLLHETHKHLLEGIMNSLVKPEDLETFAQAIRDKGAPLGNCVGFVDGTMRATCRPGKNQKAAYSGHKRHHGLKFQAVMFPNGMIGHLYGPIEGRRHDAGMLRESGLLEELKKHFRRPDGQYYCIYGDPAYPVSKVFLSPFKAAKMSGNQAEWNKCMSSVRQAVEWGFGNVANKFAFLDFKKNHKIYLQAVGKSYIVGVILANCHNALYGNQTSNYFNLDAPSLENYLLPK